MQKTVDAILSVIPVLQLYNAQLDLLIDYIEDKYDQVNTNFLLRGIFTKAWMVIIFFIIQGAVYLFLTILIDNAKLKVYSRTNRRANRDSFVRPEDEDWINGEA